MNGWNLLGWLAFGCAAATVLAVVLILSVVVWQTSLRPWIMRRWRHYRTRNVTPAQGQIWNQNGDLLRIEWIDTKGRVGIHIGGTRWSDSPEQWRKRVRYRCLYLVRGHQLRGGMIP